LLPLAAVVAQFFAPVQAQQQAATLDDLLTQVENVRADETQSFEQRRAQYNGAQAAEQTTLLRDAEARRTQLNAQSETLADTYSANEVRINNLNTQLREKATQLGLSELFGIARQTANDTSQTLQQSLITAQFPPAEGQLPRDEFLRQFSSSRITPQAPELERLWLEIQREMTASGQVARFRANVVQPGGDAVASDVIRIGPFTATANGQFLNYLPNLRALTVLPRQLPPEFMSVAASFQNASSGYARAVVDSNRGVLLGLYVERPTIMERIELGEAIGYVIIVVGALGLLAFLYQLVTLLIVRAGVNKQLKNLAEPKANNPLGRVLLAFKGDRTKIEEDADIAELRITEAVLREVPRLERFQAFLRLGVAAGPLLGLIGTVVGMIITFQSITESGSSDPKLMATGIGQAMIATVLGLGIAIPLLFANALLNSLSRGVVQVLDEQSAGMLAESIEKQRRA
jgi:biopolymer transport protein ExbB